MTIVKRQIIMLKYLILSKCQSRDKDGIIPFPPFIVYILPLSPTFPHTLPPLFVVLDTVNEKKCL